MSESQNLNKYDLYVARIRLAVYIISVLVMLVGFVLPLFTKDWAFGAWLLLVGFVTNSVSDIGRPVIINLFNEITEKTKDNFMGYNPSGYV